MSAPTTVAGALLLFDILQQVPGDRYSSPSEVTKWLLAVSQPWSDHALAVFVAHLSQRHQPHPWNKNTALQALLLRLPSEDSAASAAAIFQAATLSPPPQDRPKSLRSSDSPPSIAHLVFPATSEQQALPDKDMVDGARLGLSAAGVTPTSPCPQSKPALQAHQAPSALVPERHVGILLNALKYLEPGSDALNLIDAYLGALFDRHPPDYVLQALVHVARTFPERHLLQVLEVLVCYPQQVHLLRPMLRRAQALHSLTACIATILSMAPLTTYRILLDVSCQCHRDPPASTATAPPGANNA
ncbi:uncharacterized protein MONBRDRAFT_28947 [Monosiga brevicollis MX1]|uniref:CCR4-NOT transcription complex subunit 11 n=1 Tax=Monosiga brevicollis TaxID=81824 RepID=A9V9M7_MONBE|nr:uncharacterized protein MONBRDRAFT_28947 [Monosiga brevicollis MX1]EDQ85696.1 predicted protein [Monosiga brevicollis MX1]|eukprot:XP_001749411.1 hypothetical protein [Monosiga brevicollis MX1]